MRGVDGSAVAHGCGLVGFRKQRLLLTLDASLPTTRSGHMKMSLSFDAVFDPADKIVVFQGSLLDLFSIRCLTTLQNADPSFIAKCPECSRIFLRRVRKQQYCSKRCINRVSRREWLKKPKNQKKESEWAHSRYERRVQQKTSENALVDRRPRSKKKITTRQGGKH